MTPLLLCIGGEDHHLRVPFLLGLRRRGFHLTAAGTAAPLPFADSDIEYHQIAFSRFFSPVSDWKSIEAFARLVRRLRPDLVQCFDTKPCILVPLAARKMPDVDVVCTVNGLGRVYSTSAPLAVGLRPVLEMAQRAAAASTAVTIFQNAEDQAYYRRKHLIGPGGDRIIAGSGVDIDAFDQAAALGPTPDRLRKDLGLTGAEVVLTVARMTREKGIPILLEAAALVHESRPTVQFLLVGPFETEGRNAVRKADISRHAPYVSALGPRTDVSALLRSADLFVLPTELREGVPRTLLEAAAAALPIVTTRMPGCTDVIRDGWNGYLVPPRRPQLLADKIIDQLENKQAAKVMGARAAEFVRREFSLELTVERYAAVYEGLLRRAERSGPRLRLGSDLAFQQKEEFAVPEVSNTFPSKRVSRALSGAGAASSVPAQGTIGSP